MPYHNILTISYLGPICCLCFKIYDQTLIPLSGGWKILGDWLDYIYVPHGQLSPLHPLVDFAVQDESAVHPWQQDFGYIQLEI